MAKITLSDFNSRQSRVANILGNGTGQSGYGQTLESTQLASQKIKASDYTKLIQDISKCNLHQVGSPVSSPTFAQGQKIKNSDFVALDAAILLIETNKMAYAPASRTVVANAYEVTTPTTWGNGSTSSITAEISMTWPSYDKARHFFNSGGAITLTLSHNSTATTHDSSWQTALNSIGTITLSALTSTKSGTNGTVITNGFYNLGTSYSTVVDAANAGNSTYSSNAVMVRAKVVGAVLTFSVSLSDNYTNADLAYDTLQGSTKVSLGYAKAVNPLVGIATPTFATVSPFPSATPSLYWNSNETEMFSESSVAGYGGNIGGEASITFKSDGSITYGGLNTASSAGPTVYTTLPGAGVGVNYEISVQFFSYNDGPGASLTAFGQTGWPPPLGQSSWFSLGTDRTITLVQPSNGGSGLYDSSVVGMIFIRDVTQGVAISKQIRLLAESSAD